MGRKMAIAAPTAPRRARNDGLERSRRVNSMSSNPASEMGAKIDWKRPGGGGLDSAAVKPSSATVKETLTAVLVPSGVAAATENAPEALGGNPLLLKTTGWLNP
jgi:hypothetical protein